MEILDSVYRTFFNLEKGYARSKKSREEYIRDKFGGDIDIGAMLILDAVNGVELTDPEDIRKLTFVTETIKRIQELKDSLGSVTNFTAFTTTDDAVDFWDTLLTSLCVGTKQRPVSQVELHKMYKQVYHYACGPGGCEYAPLDTVKVFRAYNEHVVNYALSKWQVQEAPDLDKFFEVQSNTVVKLLTDGQAIRRLKV